MNRRLSTGARQPIAGKQPGALRRSLPVVPLSTPKSDDLIAYECHPNLEAAAGLVGLSVATVERELIVATLALTGGNRTHAAHLLGISLRTLRNKLRLYRTLGAKAA